VKIHGHPQKTDYASPAEWPTVSFQGHWVAPGLTPMPMAGLPGICHTHIDVKFPIYAELNAPVVCTFTVKLFHTQGRFGGFYTSLIRDIVWDETGSATVPPFVGDPMGLVVKTGRFTVDLAMPTYYPNVLHGWASPVLTGGTSYDNGDSTLLAAQLPFFSVLDPAVPEPSMANGGGPVLRSMVEVANTTVFASNTVPISYGETLAEYSNEVVEFIPLAPITAPWVLSGGTDGYGSVDLPPGMLEVRLDLDFHNNVPGTVLHSQTGISHQNATVVFDPAVLAASTPPVGVAPGTHKVALIRRQTDGPEAVWALVVIDVPVGAFVPPTPVVVPNVMGQTQAAATDILSAAGFLVQVLTESNALVPAGLVSAQDPVMGVTANSGSLVRLTISAGPMAMPVVVPNVMGLTQMVGSNSLLAVGLSPVIVMASDAAAAGTIIAQQPMMGVSVPVGSPVTLTVSSGPVVTPSQWVVVTPIIKKLTVPGGLDRFCLCVEGTTECVELVVKPDPGSV
jgi:hypothetical protein